MYLWNPTPCLNAFWHGRPYILYIFGNVFIILFVWIFCTSISFCVHIHVTKSSKVNLGFVKESARLYQGSLQWRITTSRLMFATGRRLVENNYKSTGEQGDNTV